MKTPASVALLTAACILSTYAAAFQTPPTRIDRDLEEAKTLYQEARFTDAIVRLQTTVDRLKLLEDLQARKANLADAYLHLALSYFALAELAAAKEEFKNVVRIDPNKRLDPQVYAPQVIALLEEARTELGRLPGVAPPIPSPKPSPSASPGAVAKKGGSKTLPILLGVGAVGGVAVAAAGGGGSGSSSQASTPARTAPSVTLDAPGGTGAITAVSVLTFTAAAANLTSPAFSWNFGDGQTGGGASVQHRFDAEGSFNVTVTATGSEGTATASRAVTSRSLTGRWVNQVQPCPSGTYCVVHDIIQQGATISGSWTIQGSAESRPTIGRLINGLISSPNAVKFEQDQQCRRLYTGTVNSALDMMVVNITAQDFTCTVSSEAYRRQ